MPGPTNTEPSPTAHPEYANINVRIQSLEWTCATEKKVLAHLGFFQSGQDTLTCYKCGLVTNEIKPGQDPIHWHYNLSPDCAHLHGVLHNDILNTYFEDHDPDVIGLVNENLRSNAPLVSLQFGDYRQRLATFKKWPVNFQSPQILAEAGFFFTGNGDTVRCFACNGGLKDWEPDDDPWEEHVQHFPHCHQVKQRKVIQKSRQVPDETCTPKPSFDVNENPKEQDQGQCDGKTDGDDISNGPLDRFVCFLCRESIPRVFLLPCQHLILCWECASPLSRCPVCKTNIVRKIDAFLS